ncbi:MAG: histidinol dehydrogenase [Gammaproteobacteria bacterium]
MSIEYIKKAPRSEEILDPLLSQRVREMLGEIRGSGEEAVKRYSNQLDSWEGDIVVTRDAILFAREKLSQKVKDDICFAHDNITCFAEAQKNTISEFCLEITPGFEVGQKNIPVSSAGCYVPGGRYSHIASALMTVTTARVAGVRNIIACSPPKSAVGISDEVLFALDLCGANTILNLGGVQGIAAMAYGLFGVSKADILVGPGNQYVAEAKRQLFGQIGIDMFAGPTDSLVIADSTADPLFVATDLIGQAEHGYNSPVWLVTNDRKLANKVLELAPTLIAELPENNAKNAGLAWQNYAEVILCDSREEMADVADDYAPEHLHVQASDLDWWLQRLKSYGSLFLGEETTVPYGDKAAGPNHVLPTSGAAKYTGGLSVHKYMKTVTWQRSTKAGSKDIALATARISRLEGMEGHAKSADVRLAKYFPDESFELGD